MLMVSSRSCRMGNRLSGIGSLCPSWFWPWRPFCWAYISRSVSWRPSRWRSSSVCTVSPKSTWRSSWHGLPWHAFTISSWPSSLDLMARVSAAKPLARFCPLLPCCFRFWHPMAWRKTSRGCAPPTASDDVSLCPQGVCLAFSKRLKRNRHKFCWLTQEWQCIDFAVSLRWWFLSFRRVFVFTFLLPLRDNIMSSWRNNLYDAYHVFNQMIIVASWEWQGEAFDAMFLKVAGIIFGAMPKRKVWFRKRSVEWNVRIRIQNGETRSAVPTRAAIGKCWDRFALKTVQYMLVFALKMVQIEIWMVTIKLMKVSNYRKHSEK